MSLRLPSQSRFKPSIKRPIPKPSGPTPTAPAKPTEAAGQAAPPLPTPPNTQQLPPPSIASQSSQAGPSASSSAARAAPSPSPRQTSGNAPPTPRPTAPVFRQPPASPAILPSARQPSVPPTPRASGSTPRPAGRPALIQAAAAASSSRPPTPAFVQPPTPMPTQTSGFPPSLAAIAPPPPSPRQPRNVLVPTNGPPSLAPAPREEEREVDQGRSATPTQEDVATLAAAIIGSIAPVPGSERPKEPTPPPPKKRKKRASMNRSAPPATDASAEGVDETDLPADVEEEARLSDLPDRREEGIKRRRKAKDKDAAPAGPRVRRRQTMKRTPRVTADGDVEDTLDEDAASVSSAPARKPRISRSRPAGVPRSHPELDNAEPNSFIGMEVDPELVTMKDLATKLISEGKVSARALKLHAFQRMDEQRKRREKGERAEEIWRRKQIQRRKRRQIANAEREERREQLRSEGLDPMEVSMDEMDSDEEFEWQPDRLTPESSPEPGGRIEPVRVDLIFEEAQNGDGQGEGGLDGQDPATEVGTGVDGAEQEGGEAGGEEDMDEYARQLHEAGFVTRSSPAPGDEEGEADDEARGEEYDWENGSQVDYDVYREQHEAQRRAALEELENRVVEEVDDETRMINSLSFAKKRPLVDKWSKDETEFFFLILSETGENYTMMAAYFPGRTIGQLKRKGLRENKANPERMNAAIMNRRPMDHAYLAKSAGYDHERAWDREDELLRDAESAPERMRNESVVQDGREGEEGEVGLGREEDGLPEEAAGP